MSVGLEKPGRSARQTRSLLRHRLEVRFEEIEQAALTRVAAIADYSEVGGDPTYAVGLRAAVTAAVRFGLAAIDEGTDHRAPIPIPLLAQARLAARCGISLDTVLRRYFAGYSLLGSYMLQEATAERFDPSELMRLMRAHAALFDRLLAVVGEEYERECQAHPYSLKRELVERIERLLKGELVETADIAYDFNGHQLGAITRGHEVVAPFRDLARDLDASSLVVERGDHQALWIWFGSRRRLDPALLLAKAREHLPDGAILSIGEPAVGLRGWRLTHWQAAAALPVALRANQPVVRYGDAVLLAAVLRDDLLAASLRQLYLDPLKEGGDRGAALRATLRAYFAAERNGASAASALGISRQTVKNRLQAVEERIGRSLTVFGTDIDVALRLDEWDEPAESAPRSDQ